MCLFHVLTRLRAGLTLMVGHIDHGLSPQSEEVARRVAADVAATGHDVHVVRAQGLEGPNLHERARSFRYSFLEGLAEREGADVVATGHTLDDRVETTLARLIHGGGTDVLAGLAPRSGVRIRPLIDLRRAETRAYCREVGITWHDDPANEDPRFERVAIRTELVAPIEQRWGEGAIRAIGRSAERLAEDAEALGAQARLLLRSLVRGTDGEGEGEAEEMQLDAATMRDLPRALRRRILEIALGRVRDRAAAVDEVLDALDRSDLKPDARFATAGGGEIVIGRERIAVRRPEAGAAET